MKRGTMERDDKGKMMRKGMMKGWMIKDEEEKAR